MKMILIGAGKWGENYIKTISGFKNINLLVAKRENWKNLVSDGCDGVFICTPPDSHIEIAKFCLEKNIPTMIEKPLSFSINEINSIKNFNVPILVNHIHLFSESYQLLKHLTSNINIQKIVSLGYNNGPHRNYSSLWDYGCHDISMILDLLNKFPQNIDVNEIKTKNGSLFNIKMYFDNIKTESLVGNGGSKKVRKIKLEADGLNLIYDDKIKHNNKNLPLTNAINVFIAAINGKNDNRIGLDLSYNVTQIITLCEKKLNQFL